jgi:hypothetical protein
VAKRYRLFRERLGTKEVERRTFDALAPTLGWDVVSVRQPEPPQPDILCEVVAIGPLAVELVALDEEAARRRMNNMYGTPHAWRLAMTWWAEEERTKLLADLHDAYISVHVDNDTGTRDRATMLHGLQSFLRAHPGFTGKVTAEDLEYPDGFHAANIGHVESVKNGPHVTAPSGDYWRPPQVEKITAKLRDKVYEPVAPLELFAYSTYDDPVGHVGLLEQIQAVVAEHLPGSLFRRVHLFHVGLKQHIWSSP